MTRFDVPGMSCGHCTATIEKTIKAVDLNAKVTCNTGTRKVDVDSTLSENALAEAIRNAGYEVRAAATL